MARVVVYSRTASPKCASAISLLREKGITYEEISLTDDPTMERQMLANTASDDVPQVIVNDQPIGGWEELAFLESSGALDRMIALGPDDLAAVRRIVA